MNKFDLARRLARKSHRSAGEAADQVEKLVYDILKDLKQSKSHPIVKAKEQKPLIPAAAPKERP